MIKRQESLAALIQRWGGQHGNVKTDISAKSGTKNKKSNAKNGGKVQMKAVYQKKGRGNQSNAQLTSQHAQETF